MCGFASFWRRAPPTGDTAILLPPVPEAQSRFILNILIAVSVCFQGGRGNGGRLHSRHLDGRKSPAENARPTEPVARHHSCRRPESSFSAAVSLHVFHQQTDGSEGALDSSDIGVAKHGF